MVGEIETFCALAAVGSSAAASATASRRDTGRGIEVSCKGADSGGLGRDDRPFIGRAEPARLLTGYLSLTISIRASLSRLILPASTARPSAPRICWIVARRLEPYILAAASS